MIPSEKSRKFPVSTKATHFWLAGQDPQTGFPQQGIVSPEEIFCTWSFMITPRISRRSTKFMVDGQGKTWYNTACDFPSEAHALVWLSWQSSSLVMSRSPVRIRPQAPKVTVFF